jgi:hypothetical protein
VSGAVALTSGSSEIAPTTTAKIGTLVLGGANPWFNTPVSVDLTVADGTSPLAYTQYWLSSTGTTVTITAPDAIPAISILSDGVYSLRYFSASSIAAEAVRSTVIRRDATAPTTSYTGPTTLASGTTVSLSLSDGTSGVASTVWRLDSGGENAYTGPISVPAGAHTLYFRSTDAASNVQDWQSTSLTVAPAAVRSTITIATTATSARTGSVPVLSGSVTPGASIGRLMVVYVKKPGKAYWTYSSNRVVYNRGGSAAWLYKYAFKKGMAKGVYVFKAVLVATEAYTACESPTTVSIRLR